MYNEAEGLVEVHLSAILDLVGTNQFMPGPQHLCHSLKGCALLPSPLFQFHLTDGITEPRGFPGGSVVKNLSANAGDVGSIPGSGRSPGEENGNPL